MSHDVAVEAARDQRDRFAAVEDLVLVSNREPYRHHYEGGDERGDEERVTIETPAGGLARGIDPVMQRIDGTWIAWGNGDADFAMTDQDDRVGVPPSDPAYTLQRLRLSDEQVRGYYDGYANQALWPLCHSATCRVNFEREHWRHYRQVNEQFAEAALEHVDENSTLWFQDYHFALAPRVVRASDPDAFMMHFFHIPWPAPDVFRLCPQDSALLDGLLGNDLLGFHRPRYCAQFLACVDQLLEGASVDSASGTVRYEGRTTHVGAFPFSVDAEDIRQTTEETDWTFVDQFREQHAIDADTRIALGVDRLDYTKGIPERLDALERLFETRPDLRGDLTYVQKGCVTRERVPAYQRLREEIEAQIRALNERFGTDGWSPVVYTTDMLDREDLFSLYRDSDLALVSPLRDGMNLVAKEYVAAQTENSGVLLLSPFTGAAEELGYGPVEFDPYDTVSAAEAIEYALAMDGEERAVRMRSLRRQVHEDDLFRWLDDVLAATEEIRPSPEVRPERPV